MELGNLWQIQQIMLKATQPDRAGPVGPHGGGVSGLAGWNCLYRACFENSVVRRGVGRQSGWVCAWASLSQGHYRGWKVAG